MSYKVGDTEVITEGAEHKGHTITVLKVQEYPGDHETQAEPDAVTVRCSCDKTWTFEDIDEFER